MTVDAFASNRIGATRSSRHARPHHLPSMRVAPCVLVPSVKCVLAIEGGDTAAVGLFADDVAVHVTDYLAAVRSLSDFAAACFLELRCCRIVPCFGGGIGAHLRYPTDLTRLRVHFPQT